MFLCFNWRFSNEKNVEITNDTNEWKNWLKFFSNERSARKKNFTKWNVQWTINDDDVYRWYTKIAKCASVGSCHKRARDSLTLLPTPAKWIEFINVNLCLRHTRNAAHDEKHQTKKTTTYHRYINTIFTICTHHHFNDLIWCYVFVYSLAFVCILNQYFVRWWDILRFWWLKMHSREVWAHLKHHSWYSSVQWICLSVFSSTKRSNAIRFFRVGRNWSHFVAITL